jgi:hypothetical protein
VSFGALHGSGVPPRRGRWARTAGRLSTAAWIALLVVLGISMLAMFGGLAFLKWTVFTIGLIGFVGVCVLFDFIRAASQVVEGDDPRQRRTRRRLAVLELGAILACFAGSWYVAGGWDVFVTFPEQIVFGLLWTGSSAATVIAFRDLRRQRGISEQPAPPSYHPEDSPEVAERFWSDRAMRRHWWIIMAYGFFGALAIVVLAVVVGGDNPTAAVLTVFTLLVPLIWGLVALSSYWKVPLMSALPPRPLPEIQEVPDVVRFRPRLNAVRVLATVPTVLVPTYVGVAFELASGEAPIMPRAVAVALTVVGGVIMVATLIAAVRSGRLAVEANPEGIRIVNFFDTHEIPWEEIAAVEPAPHPIVRALAIGMAGAIGQDVTLSKWHPLCVRVGDRGPIPC